MSLKVYAKIRFGHFWFVLALSTIVLAGNDPFSTKNITQNRKRFITQPKPIKYKDDGSTFVIYTKKLFFSLGVAHVDPFFAQIGPQNSNF